MAAIHSDEFKRDAVRIAQSSKDQKTIRGIVFPEDGLTRRQVASDLGIGHSTLGKWVRAFSGEAKVPAKDAELLRENERLCKENRILREAREVPKKAAMYFAAHGGAERHWSECCPDTMKFQYISKYRGDLARNRLYRLMGLTERGLDVWKKQPRSHRKWREMVLLAHIRDQYRLSLGSYGAPRTRCAQLMLRRGQWTSDVPIWQGANAPSSLAKLLF